MAAKVRAAEAAPIAHHKDSCFPSIANTLPLKQRKVLAFNFLKDGQRFTARDLNAWLNFNDGRKLISDWRRYRIGFEIRDCRQRDHRKIYWVVSILVEPTLFAAEEGGQHE